MKKIGVLDLAGHKFTVYTSNVATNPLLEDVWGYCSLERQEIVLCEGQKPDAAFQVVLHEALHGIIARSGIGAYMAEKLGCAIGADKVSDFEETVIRLLVPHLFNAIVSMQKLKL